MGHTYFCFHIIAPSKAPESLTLISITSSTVTLAWDPPPIYSHNGIIRHYIIIITDSSNEKLMYNVTGNTITISDLLPYSDYNIAVSAYTIANGPFSSILTVITSESGMYCNFKYVYN